MTDTNLSNVTEMKNEQSENLHAFSTKQIIELMNSEDRTVIDRVQKAIPQIEVAIDQVVACLKNGGRVYYFGAGTSGRLGVLDASECPPTFGVPSTLINGIIAGGDHALRYAVENAEDDIEAGRNKAKEVLTNRDLVVGIASSGRTPYVIGALEYANEQNIPTVGLSCNLNSVLSTVAKYPIEVPVGPEIVTGSTRLKAGTAQKMVLNMISTTSMIKLGKVYQNYMVNLQATNAKLRRRSISIITEITGVGEEVAKEFSHRAEGDTRIAILMIMFGIEIEKAKETLKAYGDHFPHAMAALTEENNATERTHRS
ncbi:N-acetylmuramic acid 6-phosphate etherase [Radiobacillus kanasensis]|uniref:N-acetylmuramic acid 6-phosphate etherase n=1 Tax=Radiobacillus kanasensis TaxID=2844358 RepID=UPI001E37627A|nr:N-acetylmuramic acid 6-phosphate etherase [Radiobacillus kanasensis]UFT98707.1 N-acetylmuramic acid 6-phosphate etherase [Radiobacillus kanasensis]